MRGHARLHLPFTNPELRTESIETLIEGFGWEARLKSILPILMLTIVCTRPVSARTDVSPPPDTPPQSPGGRSRPGSAAAKWVMVNPAGERTLGRPGGQRPRYAGLCMAAEGEQSRRAVA